MNELEELRRRLEDATPEFPALAPGRIRDRVRRRRQAGGAAAVLVAALLAGAAVGVPRLLLDPPAPAPVATATPPVVTPTPTPTTAPARACPTRSPRDASQIVDYDDAVRVGGRYYASAGERAGRPVRQARLGTVLCTIASIRPDSGYLFQDGDASFLPAGTTLWSVRGLPSWFRVVTGTGRIYDGQPSAGIRRGGDILPLTGQVVSIEWVAVDGGTRRLTDPAAVTAAVDGIVAAPAHPESGRPGEVGGLVFRLRDGTTVTRQWDVDRHLIVGDIQLPASVEALLRSAR